MIPYRFLSYLESGEGVMRVGAEEVVEVGMGITSWPGLATLAFRIVMGLSPTAEGITYKHQGEYRPRQVLTYQDLLSSKVWQGNLCRGNICLSLGEDRHSESYVL